MKETLVGALVFMAGIIATTTTGVAYKTLNKSKKGLLIDELGRLRDDLYTLSKINERGRKELELSYNKDINRDRDLLLEVQRLRTVLKEINESQRKIALDELAATREELLELSLTNEDAKKELQNSHSKRVSTEDTAKEETKRLRRVIGAIRNYNKKALLDNLSTLRDKLYILSDENERAKIALDESFEKQLNLEQEISLELNRLELVLQDILEKQRKEYIAKLTDCRNRLYDLSIENDLAKQELDNSYRKRLTSNKCYKNEIQRLELLITEIKGLNRKKALNELNALRDGLYSKSKENDFARMSLEDSYNRRVNDEIIEKEIERLEEVTEKIKREDILANYKKRFNFI